MPYRPHIVSIILMRYRILLPEGEHRVPLQNGNDCLFSCRTDIAQFGEIQVEGNTVFQVRHLRRLSFNQAEFDDLLADALETLQVVTGRIFDREELRLQLVTVDGHAITCKALGIQAVHSDSPFLVLAPNRKHRHMSRQNEEPAEIRDSILLFRKDHPKPESTAFLMMGFEDTPAHHQIFDGIRDVFISHGIQVLRADDKQYHDDLLSNILTYIYGVSFGIAVFERLMNDDFNPNVSLEVGYMFALGKPVCLLKDQTLKTLHTDLVGKLYRTFDPQKAKESIKPPVQKWALDKGIISA